MTDIQYLVKNINIALIAQTRQYTYAKVTSYIDVKMAENKGVILLNQDGIVTMGISVCAYKLCCK